MSHKEVCEFLDLLDVERELLPFVAEAASMEVYPLSIDCLRISINIDLGNANVVYTAEYSSSLSLEICQFILKWGTLGFPGFGNKKVQHQLELSARVLIASWRPSAIHLTSYFQESLYFFYSDILLNGWEEGNFHKE